MTRKLIIFHLTSSSDIGGTERMLIHFLSKTDKSRFEHTVCSLIGGGRLTRKIQELGFEAQTLDLHHPFQIGKVARLFQLMKSRRFNLIQTYGLRADTFGRALGRWAGIPVVVSSIRSPDPWRRWYHRLIDRATLPFADFFISNSEAGRQSRIANEKYPPQKIALIRNGIPAPPAVKPDQKVTLRHKYGVDMTASPVIAMVSNLRVMKGHADVIQAIYKIKDRLPHILFLFAGRDDSNGAIEEMARKTGTAPHIRFLGYCPEPTEILAISDMFLLPSHWEGCPASLLEAMAIGLPCIATNAGGIPEIITNGHNGVLIPPADPSAIADAILSMAEKPHEARAMAAAAQKTFFQMFALERMVNEYENIYEELTARPCR